MFGQCSANTRDRDYQVRSTGITGRARIKRVFTTPQTAHVWAAQSQDDGRSSNGNLYFRGRTIYSYRDSWPLACFVRPDVVLINSEKYSVTTSGHLSDVRGALRGKDLITIDTDSDTLFAFDRADEEKQAALASKIISHWQESEGASLALSRKWAEKRGESDTFAGYHFDQFKVERERINRFANLFSVPEPMPLLSDLEMAQALVSAHHAKVTAEKEAKQQERITEARGKLENWSADSWQEMLAPAFDKIIKMRALADSVLGMSYAELITLDSVPNCFPGLKWPAHGAQGPDLYSLRGRTLSEMSRTIVNAKGADLKPMRDKARANLAKVKELIALWEENEPAINRASQRANDARFIDRMEKAFNKAPEKAEKEYNAYKLSDYAKQAFDFGRVEFALKLWHIVSRERAIAEMTPYFHRPSWMYELDRKSRALTVEQKREAWLKGESVSFHQETPTLLRKKGQDLQTSRGANAPFREALMIFAKAQQCRATGKGWHRNGERMQAGAFELDRIDSEGNISIGCHRIAFGEMQRLAIKEAPAMVKPRFPVPACL
jgi:hypothetical protein